MCELKALYEMAKVFRNEFGGETTLDDLVAALEKETKRQTSLEEHRQWMAEQKEQSRQMAERIEALRSDILAHMARGEAHDGEA